MSLISDVLDFVKSLVFIDDTLKDMKAGNAERDLTIQALGEKFADLDKRVSNLETARNSDLARMEAALAQLAAERKGMAADFERYERYMMQFQRDAPQLPPTNPTDN